MCSLRVSHTNNTCTHPNRCHLIVFLCMYLCFCFCLFYCTRQVCGFGYSPYAAFRPEIFLRGCMKCKIPFLLVFSKTSAASPCENRAAEWEYSSERVEDALMTFRKLGYKYLGMKMRCQTRRRRCQPGVPTSVPTLSHSGIYMSCPESCTLYRAASLPEASKLFLIAVNVSDSDNLLLRSSTGNGEIRCW